MSTQHSVVMTVSSSERNKTRYPAPNRYEMALPQSMQRVRQVMLSSLEFAAVQRNVEAPGADLPFGEGAQIQGGMFRDDAGNDHFENEVVVVRRDGEACASAVVALPLDLNGIVSHDGSATLTTASPHGLALALRVGLRLAIVGAGCEIPLTCDTVSVVDENSFTLQTTCVDAALLVGCWVHVQPLLQADVLALLQAGLPCYTVDVTDEGGLRWRAPHRFDVVLGATTAAALGLAIAGGARSRCAVVLEATAPRAEEEGSRCAADSWQVQGRAPPALLARLPPRPAQSYDIPSFSSGMATAMNGIVLPHGKAHSFCIRTGNGVPHMVSIKPGQYTAEQLASAVQHALNRACDTDTDGAFHVAHSQGTYAISNDRCCFSLELQIHPSTPSEPVPPTHFIRLWMGFQGRQYTGKSCYTGDVVHRQSAILRYPRFRYKVSVADSPHSNGRGLTLGAERWYAGEACEKCVSGTVTAADDIATLDYDGTTFTILCNSMLGLRVGDVVALGLPSCAECPIISVVQDVVYPHPPTTGTQQVIVHVTDAIKAWSCIGELLNKKCPIRLWLWDAPRFELPLYPAVSTHNRLIEMLGLAHAYHGGASCYEAVACWNMNVHPFILVRIGTPSFSAPFKYYGGTNKIVPITTTLSASNTYRAFSETYDFKTSGSRKIGSIYVEFLNPDLTPYEFHGGDHYLTLMFVCEGDQATLSCA